MSSKQKYHYFEKWKYKTRTLQLASLGAWINMYTHTHRERVKGPPSSTIDKDPKLILTLKEAALDKTAGFHKFMLSQSPMSADKTIGNDPAY